MTETQKQVWMATFGAYYTYCGDVWRSIKTADNAVKELTHLMSSHSIVDDINRELKDQASAPTKKTTKKRRVLK